MNCRGGKNQRRVEVAVYTQPMQAKYLETNRDTCAQNFCSAMGDLEPTS